MKALSVRDVIKELEKYDPSAVIGIVFPDATSSKNRLETIKEVKGDEGKALGKIVLIVSSGAK